MWTILFSVTVALYVVTELQPWGLTTFGLIGWWLMATLIGLMCGFTVGVTGYLLRRVR